MTVGKFVMYSTCVLCGMDSLTTLLLCTLHALPRFVSLYSSLLMIRSTVHCPANKHYIQSNTLIILYHIINIFNNYALEGMFFVRIKDSSYEAVNMANIFLILKSPKFFLVLLFLIILWICEKKFGPKFWYLRVATIYGDTEIKWKVWFIVWSFHFTYFTKFILAMKFLWNHKLVGNFHYYQNHMCTWKSCFWVV